MIAKQNTTNGFAEKQSCATKERDKSDDSNKAAPTFAPVAPFDPLTLPRRPWVVPNLACRNVVTLVAGPGGVAKSTWTLQVAVATVTGRSDICGFVVPKRARVLVWNQEDDFRKCIAGLPPSCRRSTCRGMT